MVGRHDLFECLGHAEEAQLIEAIEGGMGEHDISSMVVARAADVGMEDRRTVRGTLGRGVAIQVVVEDGLDRSVGSGADVERACGGSLDPLMAERLDQPYDAEASAEALLG